jgi:hypothetical protein
VQTWPLPQPFVHALATQSPFWSHVSPLGQVTKPQAWTQNPARQNVPSGQLRPAQGSASHVALTQI